jgi:hypothetical protein
MDILGCFSLDFNPLSDLLLGGSVYRGEIVRVDEELESVVPLEKRYIFETGLFEPRELVVRSGVVPLSAAGIPV